MSEKMNRQDLISRLDGELPYGEGSKFIKLQFTMSSLNIQCNNKIHLCLFLENGTVIS